MRANYLPRFQKEQKLKGAVEAKLQEVYSEGLSVGGKSIAKALCDIALDESKTEHERLIAIVEFCKTALGAKPKKGE